MGYFFVLLSVICDIGSGELKDGDLELKELLGWVVVSLGIFFVVNLFFRGREVKGFF